MDLINSCRLFGLDIPFTGNALKSAYRGLSKKYHPDLGGDPEKFKDITKTYNFLKKYIGIPKCIEIKGLESGDELFNGTVEFYHSHNIN